MLQGDVFTFLNALGAREGDPRLEHALAFVDGPHEVEVFDEGGVQDKYLVMTDRGVDFLLKDGVLTTVFVYATDTPDQSTYGGWASLVGGVSPGASPDDVVQALGEPLRSTESFVRYRVDPGFVQFDFDGDALKMLVVMREVVGGDAPQAAADEVEGAKTVDGDLAVFMRAVGHPMFSPTHMAVIGLAGPATDSYDEERGGAMWQYEDSARTGVTLQFTQDVLVGALIKLRAEDGKSGYPTPELLIAGLALPASRDTIGAHFGTPRQTSQQMDLYLVDDRYLRFDFDAGLSTAVTVVLPGAEA